MIFKHKKETEKDLSHTDVYLNKKYIGYIIQNNSIYSNKDENWNFVGASGYRSFYAKTKKELINMI